MKEDPTSQTARGVSEIEMTGSSTDTLFAYFSNSASSSSSSCTSFSLLNIASLFATYYSSKILIILMFLISQLPRYFLAVSLSFCLLLVAAIEPDIPTFI